MTRHIAKKDDNHNEIKNNLEACGFSVWDTHQLGNNFPDMIVACRGETAVVEIKATKGKLTEGQDEFKSLWQGKHVVARNYVDVLYAFGIDIL